jgi:hypothetical protein
MGHNAVAWFEIYVQDIERAKTFYETVFQVKLERLDSAFDMWAFPMAMGQWGAGGAIVKMDGMPSGGNSTLVYFSCADCAVEAARIEPAGGKLTREKMSIGQYGFIALGTDPDGNMFGMHSVPV